MKTQKLQFAAALAVAAVTVSCTSPSREQELPYPPTHIGKQYVRRPEAIKLFIGGAFGPSYEVFSDGVTVRYRTADSMLHLPQTKGETFTPDLARWKEFRDTLDKLNAWNWKSRYHDPTVQDGTSWQVIVIDTYDRQINSVGGNAYPENFDLFLAAVRRLIGGREFN